LQNPSILNPNIRKNITRAGLSDSREKERKKGGQGREKRKREREEEERNRRGGNSPYFLLFKCFGGKDR